MYCGIDLGSTSIKIAIYSEDFKLIDRQSRPVEYIRENGFVEFDAVAYCQILTDLLTAMVEENSIKAIRQIAFTGQAESLVVLGADGKPLMNAISWMDERSTEECKLLEQQFPHEVCEAVTGQMAVLPTWPATKILWLQKNRPAIYGAADTYMLLKDYVVYYLTGEKKSDMSIATFSFYFDIYKKCYWTEMLDAIGVKLSQLPELVVNALKAVCCLPLRDYCGVANRALMRIAYLLLGISSVAMMLWIFVKKIRNIGTCIITALLLVAFVLAVGFVEVMVPDGWIYTLMVFSFSLLACAPLAFLECLPEADKKKLVSLFRKAVILLVALLVFFYGYYANVNYTAAYFAGEQIDNYLSGVVLRTTMTEGFTTDKQWALMGDIQDPLFDSPWQEEISYTGLGFTQYLLNQYSRRDWIENYIGYDIPRADAQTIAALAETEEVRAMPCYPNAGSIRVIGDVVVVKFGE